MPTALRRRISLCALALLALGMPALGPLSPRRGSSSTAAWPGADRDDDRRGRAATGGERRGREAGVAGRKIGASRSGRRSAVFPIVGGVVDRVRRARPSPARTGHSAVQSE
jgi:hypothetical protein